MEGDYDNWKFLIREMNNKDIEEVKEIHDTLFPIIYSYEVYLEFVSDEYLSLVIEGTRHITVDNEEKEEHKIVGVATANRNWISAFSLQRSGYLATFGILPGFRKHRLGTALLSTITQCLRIYYSCKFIDLHMLATNDVAEEFYEKNGYIVRQKLLQYYTFYNKKHDALYLVNTLENFEYKKPENIELSDSVIHMMKYRQKINWLHKLCSNP